MESLSVEAQRMFPSNQIYSFYFGLSMAFQDRFQEAIRELDRCTNDRDLVLGSILALIYSHQKCQTIGLF